MYTEDKIVTPELKEQRSLAAIIFTDVVSFSALMAANEEHTLDLIRRDFQIMTQLCQRFEGKVLKTIGDGLLMYFTSAVQAVLCAKEIQSTLAEAATNLPPEDVLSHRIGIHLGDVFFSGTDVMGDGVNVAARLQAEAEPGGICMSQTVYDVVKNPLALKPTDLVPKKLKNIQDAVPVYQIPPIYPAHSTTQEALEQLQTEQKLSSNESELIINSSEQWVFLHDFFFQVETVRQNADNTLTVRIHTENAQHDAAIQSLRPSSGAQSQRLKYAYRNDGLFVKLKSVEEEYSKHFHIWILTLEPQKIKHSSTPEAGSYGAGKKVYSPDEIAELRGKRILLNDPPKLPQDARLFTPALANREKLESLIRGSGTPISVEDCVIQSLYPMYKDRPRVFLEVARLNAVFFLKAAGIVEQVLELSLGPISEGKVHVRFRGIRRQVYVNIEPAVIEIEGDCPLLSEVW